MLKILDKINCSCCVDTVCTICFNTSLLGKINALFSLKNNTSLIACCFTNTNLYLFQSAMNSEVLYLMHPPMKLFTACKLHTYKQNFKPLNRARKNMHLHVPFLPLKESKPDAQSRHDYTKTYQTQINLR